jgi:hypothetical protein
MSPAFYFELIECFSFRVRVETIQIWICFKFEWNQEIEKVEKLEKDFQP